jgi:hypothetical protein
MPAFFLPTINTAHIMIKLFILCLFVCSLSAGAANRNYLSLDLLYFDYEEFDPTGFSLNHETGFIPGLCAALVRNQHELKMSLYNGRVNYDGYTQALTPHQTETSETLFKVLYRYNIQFNPGIESPRYFLGIGHQYWMRSIQPNNGVYGLDETYTWLQAEAGTQLTLLSEPKKSILLELALLRTLNGNIRINLNELGYGTPNLDLGSTFGFQGKIFWRLATGQNQELETGVNYARWGFGRSNSKTLSNGFQTITIEEPRSESSQTIFYVGLNQYF